VRRVRILAVAAFALLSQAASTLAAQGSHYHVVKRMVP